MLSVCVFHDYLDTEFRIHFLFLCIKRNADVPGNGGDESSRTATASIEGPLGRVRRKALAAWW